MKVSFGPPVLKTDKFGNRVDTLPIVFHITDLMDLEHKSSLIFQEVFAVDFNELQEFALVISDGNQIVWPIVYTFDILMKKMWKQDRRNPPTSFILRCRVRPDLVKQYSTHMNLPIANEPDYVKALSNMYSVALQFSSVISKLGEEVRIKVKTKDELRQALEPSGKISDNDKVNQFLEGLNFLQEFQPKPEFQEIHELVLECIRDLDAQLRGELDVLRQLAEDLKSEIRIQSLLDLCVGCLDTSLHSSSSFQKKEVVRSRHSKPVASEVNYNEFDIQNKVGGVYMLAYNYFYFGRTTFSTWE